MSKIQVQVTVEKSAYDLGKNLGGVVAGLAQKKNIAAMAAEEFAQLQTIIDDVKAVKSDLAEDKVAFMKGAAIGLEEGLEPLFAPAPASAS